jgi:hypothetical protein
VGRTKVKGGLFLDIVVRQGAAVLELLAGEDQTLLVGRNTKGRVQSATAPTTTTDKRFVSPLLVLNLGLDIVDGVAGLDLKGDGLACEGLHEDLHDDWVFR